MTYENIIVENKDRITHITLNRPGAMNSLTTAMHQEMQEALDAFAANDNQWICVIKGAGERAFCAGSDLKEAAAASIKGAYPKNGYAGLIERYDLSKPVIAAVNGFALGGGFEVALACDIIIAVEGAKFGLPEPLVGAVALGGGLHRLARQIGLKKAMGYIMTARQMTAEEGYQLGFVNEVVPADQLDAAVEAWCADILKGAPLAIRASKDTVMRGLDEPSIADAIKGQHGYDAYRKWQASEDSKEGPLAFAEKRPPNWQGK